ncbi:MAG: hypothetical protein HY868_06820 [Chloroflexi bacterium]|nr:hypothetical protein [Chloroflexota bacterium]
MAVTTTDLKRIQREVETLKKKVAQLEQRKNGKRRAPAKKRAPAALRTHGASENDLADEILQRAGLLAELTPAEQALAAEWRALPEERKQQVIHKLETANFKPTL